MDNLTKAWGPVMKLAAGWGATDPQWFVWDDGNNWIFWVSFVRFGAPHHIVSDINRLMKMMEKIRQGVLKNGFWELEGAKDISDIHIQDSKKKNVAVMTFFCSFRGPVPDAVTDVLSNMRMNPDWKAPPSP